MNFTLRTLTPLWTGSVDQTCDRLHETGFIGSLRWWYEALVRGLGGNACDPTEHSCIFNEDKYRKSRADNMRQRLLDADVCDACQLFGCTGWGRVFRLQISGANGLLNGRDVLIPSGRKHKTKKGDERAGGWFVFSESRVGTAAFSLSPMRAADLRPISTILALISRHASFGPKGSNGYGVVQAENLEPDLVWLGGLPDKRPARDNILPDFRDFFFARFQFTEPANNTAWWQSISGIQQAFNGRLDDDSSPPPLRPFQKELAQMKNQGIIPIAPTIRNWLRYCWKHNLNRTQEQYVFGDARSAIGSKILVSYAYHLGNGQWEFRIWGWLPCAGRQLADRDTFLNSLETELRGNAIWSVFGSSGVIPRMVEWHAMDCRRSNGRAYLQELLGGAQ